MDNLLDEIDGEYFDLIEFGHQCDGNYATRHFAIDVVYLADDIIRNNPMSEIKTISKCLASQIKRLYWWEGIGRLPLRKRHYSYVNTAETSDMLAKSVIVTVGKYRKSLDDIGGLRPILISDLLLGLEWACIIENNETLAQNKKFQDLRISKSLK